MNIEGVQTNSKQPSELICVSCKLFFGNQAFNKMCSLCHQKNQQAKSSIKAEIQKVDKILPKLLEEMEQHKKENTKEDKDRCTTCRRKIKLLGIECKCGLFFCNAHRLPEEHSCSFNHKGQGKEKLAKQAVKLDKKKIQSF